MTPHTWRFLVIQGTAVVFGILTMAWPMSAAIALVMLWGLFAPADGIGALVEAFTADGAGRRTLRTIRCSSASPRSFEALYRATSVAP